VGNETATSSQLQNVNSNNTFNALITQEQDMNHSSESEADKPSSVSSIDMEAGNSGKVPSALKILISPITKAEVILVGSVHVSKESCEDVQRVIREHKPDVVFIELCPARAGLLLSEDQSAPESKPITELLAIVKKNKGVGALQLVLAEFSRRIAGKMKVLPGGEFRAAFIEAQKINARTFLGDRPMHITLKRTWQALSYWEKIKFALYACKALLFFDITEKEIEELHQSSEDVITELMVKMKSIFPSLSRTIVTERDEWMASQLRSLQAKKIVAVVGKGHVKGIAEQWSNYDIDLAELANITPPKPTLLALMLKRAVTGVTLAGISWFLYKRFVK